MMDSEDTGLLVKGWRNGKEFDLLVYPVDQSGKMLAKEPALAWFAMRDEALIAKVDLKIVTAFRDADYQKRLWDRYNDRLDRWKLEPIATRGNKPTPAARPGWSRHQAGEALDLDVSQELTHKWLTIYASSFGWKRTVACEPWHFEYRPLVVGG